MKTFILWIGLFTSSLAASAQMTEQDKHILQRIKSELALSLNQLERVDSVFQHAQHSLDSLQQRINELQRTEDDEIFLNEQLTRLAQQKKEIKQNRELELETLLTAEQRQRYQSTIKPAKPNVLHFGVNHDRAACIVCK